MSAYQLDIACNNAEQENSDTDKSVVPDPVQVISPNIKTVHVIINNNKTYVFSRDILLSFPQTYLGYRATKLTDYADVIINKDIAEIHVHYTELYFEYVQAWYWTAQLYVPTPQEANLFHQVLNFWLIPHKNEMLDMTAMIADGLDTKFSEVLESLKQITENLRGPSGRNGYGYVTIGGTGPINIQDGTGPYPYLFLPQGGTGQMNPQGGTGQMNPQGGTGQMNPQGGTGPMGSMS